MQWIEPQSFSDIVKLKYFKLDTTEDVPIKYQSLMSIISFDRLSPTNNYKLLVIWPQAILNTNFDIIRSVEKYAV